VENIIVSCLESKQDQLIAHVLDECKLVTRILEAEKNSALSVDLTKVPNNVSSLIYSQPADRSTFPTDIFTCYPPCSVRYLQREKLHQGMDLLGILHAYPTSSFSWPTATAQSNHICRFNLFCYLDQNFATITLSHMLLDLLLVPC
jgi:hypothetical protein